MLSALHLLARSKGTWIETVSPVYLSEAHTLDGSEQPDYLNAVVRIATRLDPSALLKRCLEIERLLGRVRDGGSKWEPRRIDLDILLHSAGRVARPGLEIPHPRLSERLFVLLPLADVVRPTEFAGELEASPDELIAACPDRGRIIRTVVDLGNYK